MLKIVENFRAVGTPPGTQQGEFTALPNTLAGGEGVADRSPGTPIPLSAIGPLLLTPNDKSWARLCFTGPT